MVLVTVKWNKSSYQVDLAPELGVGAFKAQLFSLTNVPPERQKLMGKGAWAGILKDDADLTTCSINDALVVTLMGTADVIVSKPAGEVKFVEDMSAEERAKAGAELPSGLLNLGNTCYMNATVQCLRFVDGFKSLLSVHPLATQLQLLFDELDRSSAPVLPYRFLQTLRTFYPQFNEMKQGRYMQQDADEFFGALMSAITQNGMTPEFMRAIGLRMEETLTCTESAEEPVVKREEVVYKLVCNINGGAGASVVVDHLADGIKLGLEGTLEKRSDVLQRDSLWTKKQRIASLPSVLCVQFMRFFWRATPESRESAGSKCKILRAVSFTETLDIFDFCSEELQGELRNARHRAREADQTGTVSQTAAASSSDTGLPPTFTGIYELCGVVTHQGRSADSGHYMSYVRSSKTNTWIKFNDDKVSEATIEEILLLNGGGDRDMAYFCFYRMKL